MSLAAIHEHSYYLDFDEPMTSNSFESFLVIPAACAFFYNDVLALISILGSVILFLGSFPGFPFKRLIGLAEWNSAPLVFGTFFQVYFYLLGMSPETEVMGLLAPMPPWLVSGLFAALYNPEGTARLTP